MTKTFLVLLILISPISSGFSQPVISITNETKRAELTTDFLIYEDKSTFLTITDFTHRTAGDLFTVNTQVPPNKGYLKSTFWLKLNIQTGELTNKSWYLEIDYPLLDLVTLYSQDKNGEWVQSTIGDRVPFSERDIPHRNLVFPLTLESNQSHSIYLRIRSEGSLTFPITIWNPEAFRSFNLESQLLLGLYYGVSIALILFNLLLFFSIRDMNYFYYVCYITMYMLLQLSLNGLAFQYLWPDSTEWTNIATPFLIGASLFTVILFSDSFLRVKDFNKSFARFLSVLKILTLVVAVMPFIFSYQLSVVCSAVLALIVAPSVIISAFIVNREGYRPAKYFIIAWTVLLVGMVLYALKNLGAVPVGFFSNYSIQIGSVLEVILLSLALADRINLLQSELKKNEMEKKRIIKERFTLARQISVGILHQMRQPLQVLKGSIDLIKLTADSSDKVSENYVTKILTSVEKIDHHLKELERVQNTDHFDTTDYTKDEKMADLSGK